MMMMMMIIMSTKNRIYNRLSPRSYNLQS